MAAVMYIYPLRVQVTCHLISFKFHVYITLSISVTSLNVEFVQYIVAKMAAVMTKQLCTSHLQSWPPGRKIAEIMNFTLHRLNSDMTPLSWDYVLNHECFSFNSL